MARTSWPQTWTLCSYTALKLCPDRGALSTLLCEQLFAYPAGSIQLSPKANSQNLEDIAPPLDAVCRPSRQPDRFAWSLSGSGSRRVVGACLDPGNSLLAIGYDDGNIVVGPLNSPFSF